MLLRKRRRIPPRTPLRKRRKIPPRTLLRIKRAQKLLLLKKKQKRRGRRKLQKLQPQLRQKFLLRLRRPQRLPLQPGRRQNPRQDRRQTRRQNHLPGRLLPGTRKKKQKQNLQLNPERILSLKKPGLPVRRQNLLLKEKKKKPVKMAKLRNPRSIQSLNWNWGDSI